MICLLCSLLGVGLSSGVVVESGVCLLGLVRVCMVRVRFVML